MRGASVENGTCALVDAGSVDREDPEARKGERGEVSASWPRCNPDEADIRWEKARTSVSGLDEMMRQHKPSPITM